MSPGSKTAVRDALVALSLANLLCMRLWAGILDPKTAYFLDRPREWPAYVATVLVVLAIGAVGWSIAFAGRRASRAGRLGVELLFAIALATLPWMARHQVSDLLGRENQDSVDRVLKVVAVLVLAPFLVPPWRGRMVRGAAAVLRAFSPFVLLTFAQGALGALHAVDGTFARAMVERPPAAKVPSARGARVVVVVLDEMDQFLGFEDRRANVSLPTFDALSAEGYHATRVATPSNVTSLALPSILAGRRVVRQRSDGPNDRFLYFEDGTRVRFSDLETVLSDARNAGRNAAITGWYHPYCRILGDDVVDCLARAHRQEFVGMGVGRSFVRHLGVLADLAPQGQKVLKRLNVDRRVVSIGREWHAETHRLVFERSRRLAADPEIDLAFLHFALPHPPGLADATGNWAGRKGNYAGNLVLTDRALRTLIDGMRESGVWDRTALVVMSDHPKRSRKLAPLPSPRLAPGEPRPVPFFVRLPGVSGPGIVDGETRFSSVVLRELVRALFDGELHSNEEVRDWMRSHVDQPLAVSEDR